MSTTYYTGILQERDDVTLEEFVLLCARSQGAFEHMQEAPIDAPIPVVFKPRTYHKEELIKAQQDLEEWRKKGASECAKIAEEAYRRSQSHYGEYIQKAIAHRDKITPMIKKLEEWECSPLLAELKEHALKQLRLDLNSNGNPEYWEESKRAYKHKSGEKYRQMCIETAERSIELHEKGWEEANEWAKTQTEYVTTLCESLGINIKDQLEVPTISRSN